MLRGDLFGRSAATDVIFESAQEMAESDPHDLQVDLDHDQVLHDLDQAVGDREQAVADNEQARAEERLRVASDEAGGEGRLGFEQARRDSHQDRLDEEQSARDGHQDHIDRQQLDLDGGAVEPPAHRPRYERAEAAIRRATAASERADAALERAMEALRRAKAADEHNA